MSTTDAAARARREERRRTWTGKVLRSASDAELASREFFLRIPQRERAAAVWQLSRELFALSGQSPNERRLPRSDFRVQPRER